MVKLNPHRSEFSVKIEKKDVVLIPTYKNIAIYESYSDIGIVELGVKIQKQKIAVSDIAKLIFCLQKNPTLTEDEIGEDLLDKGYEGIMDVIITSLSSIWNFKSDVDQNDKKVDEKKTS